MSIQSNFPAIKPTLLLDFANTKQLDPRITFTRASTATYYGTQTAKAEENLLLQSQDLTTTWDLTNGVTATANTTVAPDGTTTADTLTEVATTAVHLALQTVSVSGVTTISVFAKPNSGTPFLTIGFNNGATDFCSATFDLSAGTSTQNQAAGAYAGASTSISTSSQGFYRCVLTVTATTVTQARIGLNNTGTPTSANRGFGANYLGVITNSIFLWGAQLEQRSAVTAYIPTTTQAITNYIPQLLTAASGVARFDHNPTTFESLGLEIEESRTNLVLRSEEFSNASWTKTNSSITADTIVAPNGTLTADKLVEDTATGNHDVRQSATTTAADHSFSVYLKSGERQFALLWNSTANFGRVFNLSNGTVSGTVTGVTQATASISSIGNGWYRCTIIGTCTAASNNFRVYAMTDATTFSYTGNGYSGIYIWGAQLEAGAFPTSYIPTVASQVTRAADFAVMTGTNFSSWYNAAQGTLYTEANTPAFATTYVFADINNNSTSNYIRHSTTSAGTSTTFNVVNNTTTTANPSVTVTLGSNRKMAGAYAVNSVQQSVNGSLGTEDTSSDIPTSLVQMNIGSRATGANVVNGTIKKIAYYPLRVTNANLQALTS
jgi:hypothetical protein